MGRAVNGHEPPDKLCRALTELENADDWEESSVNVFVQPAAPPTTSRRTLFEGLRLLPPWGRVLVVLAALLLAGLVGAGAKVIGALIGH